MAVAQPPVPARHAYHRPLIALGIVVGAIVLAGGLYAVFGGGGATSGTRSAATSTYRVAGMAIAVPSEWQRESVQFDQGAKGIYLADPRHEPGGMTFSVISAPTHQGVIRVGGRLVAALWNTPMFSNVHNQMITLPAGKAIRVTSTVTKNGGTYSDAKFAFAHHGRAYIVTFMGTPSLMTEHAAQIDAAVHSVRFIR